MSNNRKRKSSRLFDKYTTNLKLIKSKYGVVMYNNEDGKRFSDGYLCPITFDHFDNPSYEELSEEHVPQKSIGGKVICLTNRKWNNKFSKIDNDVAERSKELVFQHETGTSRAVAYINGKFKCELTMDFENDKPMLSFVGGGFKEINPDFVELMTSHENMEEFKVTMKPKGTISRNTRLGYLKNAYLLAFEKFGYSLLFGNRGCIELFNIIRKQLCAPNEKILGDLPFVFEVKDESGLEGVYYTKVKGIETISAFFRLAKDSINRAGVIFPPVNMSENEVKEWSIYGEDVDFHKFNEIPDFVSFDRFSKLEDTRYSNKEYNDING